MPAPKRTKLILAGAYAGQNIALAGYKFEKGTLYVEGTEDSVAGVKNYLGKCYQAYPEGSEELKVAQARDTAAKEKTHGKRDILGDAETSGESPDGEVQPDGDRSLEEAATGSEGHVDPEAGEVGSVPDGSGYEDPGLPETPEGGTEGGPLDGKMMELHSAVKALDPDVDSNWTEAGMPAMMALEHLGGGVTRKMVTEAVGDWDRHQSREAKALKDLS